MSLATEKDGVLIRLQSEDPELNLASHEFTTGDQRAFGDLFYRHKDELVLKGYIKCYPEYADITADRINVDVLPEGRVFINNGGYTLIEQKEEKEEKRREQEWRWRRGYESSTLIVASFACILSAVTFCSTPKESQIKDLQQRVDSLSQQVKRIGQLKRNPQSIIEGKSKGEVGTHTNRINHQKSI